MLLMKEFEHLSQLASYLERIFTRKELIELIWGNHFDEDDLTAGVQTMTDGALSEYKTIDFVSMN